MTPLPPDMPHDSAWNDDHFGAIVWPFWLGLAIGFGGAVALWVWG